MSVKNIYMIGKGEDGIFCPWIKDGFSYNTDAEEFQDGDGNNINDIVTKLMISNNDLFDFQKVSTGHYYGDVYTSDSYPLSAANRKLTIKMDHAPKIVFIFAAGYVRGTPTSTTEQLDALTVNPYPQMCAILDVESGYGIAVGEPFTRQNKIPTVVGSGFPEFNYQYTSILYCEPTSNGLQIRIDSKQSGLYYNTFPNFAEHITGTPSTRDYMKYEWVAYG